MDYAQIFIKSMQPSGESQSSFHLEEYKVPNTNTAYYVKNYISQEQESKLLDCVFNLDQDRWFEMKSGRALKRYGGEVGS